MADSRQVFAARYGPWALVAGASEGIGAAFAQAAAARGLHVLLLARRVAPLEALAAALRSDHGVEAKAIALDLGAADLPQRLHDLFDAYDIGLAVYNACYSPIGRFLGVSLADKLKMVDVNVRGPLILADVAAARLSKRGRGGLVLMSSMSGWQGSAMVATYAATKAFNTILAEGLWAELRSQGVDVLAHVAGATSTPNFQAATPQDKQAKAFPMAPAAVVEQAFAALGKGPTRIAGGLNRLVYAVTSRALSRRSAVRFFSSATSGIYDQGQL